MSATNIARELHSIYETFINALTTGANLESSAKAWHIMESKIRSQSASGRLSNYELELASILATNISTIVRQALQIEEIHEDRMNKLCSELDLIAPTADHSEF